MSKIYSLVVIHHCLRLNKGKTIVALLPNSGDRYYSTPLFTE